MNLGAILCRRRDPSIITGASSNTRAVAHFESERQPHARGVVAQPDSGHFTASSDVADVADVADLGSPSSPTRRLEDNWRNAHVNAKRDMDGSKGSRLTQNAQSTQPASSSSADRWRSLSTTSASESEDGARTFYIS